MRSFSKLGFTFVMLFSAFLASVYAHEPEGKQGIVSKPSASVNPSFDIVNTRVSVEGNVATFHIHVSAKAGAALPAKLGKLPGSSVFAYVWPTSLDPSLAGFEPKSGILAFAVTAHPDFDDTPLFDENGDGVLSNDGALWHSHWVVLVPNTQGKKGDLKVQDIKAGATVRLPKTWPGLPILIDSPGWDPVFKDDVLEVRVPFDLSAELVKAAFDGVSAVLVVNENLQAPLLRVSQVLKVGSGDLSLPGRINQ